MITRRIGQTTMPSIFHYGEAADADFYIAGHGMSLRAAVWAHFCSYYFHNSLFIMLEKWEVFLQKCTENNYESPTRKSDSSPSGDKFQQPNRCLQSTQATLRIISNSKIVARYFKSANAGTRHRIQWVPSPSSRISYSQLSIGPSCIRARWEYLKMPTSERLI